MEGDTTHMVLRQMIDNIVHNIGSKENELFWTVF